jgi:hypothetical protein
MKISSGALEQGRTASLFQFNENQHDWSKSAKSSFHHLSAKSSFNHLSMI